MRSLRLIVALMALCALRAGLAFSQAVSASIVGDEIGRDKFSVRRELRDDATLKVGGVEIQVFVKRHSGLFIAQGCG